MSSEPLVSVVLPTYNRASVLSRAMASVLSQSYRELELIVVDDGSTDQTRAVVERTADPRVRYLYRPNGGPGAARNTGVAAARGQFVAFQDSDDEWLPEKLARQMDRMRASPADIGMVLCGHREIRPEKTRELVADAHMAGGDQETSLLTGLWYVPPTWLVRRTALVQAGPFDESLPSCEDWDLAFRLCDVCRFDGVPEVLVIKHHTSGSVFDNAPGRVAGIQRILRRHRHRWRTSPYWLAHHEYWLGYWHLVHLRQRARGWRHLLQALFHHPASQFEPVSLLFRQGVRGRTNALLRSLGIVR